jgi:hypothetical protein
LKQQLLGQQLVHSWASGPHPLSSSSPQQQKLLSVMAPVASQQAAMAEKLAANASQLAAAGKNATTVAAHMLNATINGTLLSGNATNGTRFIDVEEDRIAPGYAVLLMYIMLVRTARHAAAALLCMHAQYTPLQA